MKTSLKKKEIRISKYEVKEVYLAALSRIAEINKPHQEKGNSNKKATLKLMIKKIDNLN